MNDFRKKSPGDCRLRRPKRSRAQRRAAAAVEFAISLPVVVMMLLGAVELGRSVMVNHSVGEAARAVCRVYSIGDTTQKDVDDILAKTMESAGISGYTVTYEPATKAEVDTSMEPVTVTISVPYAKVGWVTPNHMSGAVIVGRCTLPADIEMEESTKIVYSELDDDNETDGHKRDKTKMKDRKHKKKGWRP